MSRAHAPGLSSRRAGRILPGLRLVPGAARGRGRTTPWRAALLVLALTACRHDAAGQAPSLNSERIQQRFGSYGIQVLQQEGECRVACLYSEEASGRVCRTVAVTLFDRPPPALQTEYGAVRAGASLGATLKASGWDVVKRDHVLATRVTGPAFASLLGWPAGEPAPTVAVDTYALWVERPGHSFRFARIAEAHHPGYLDLPAIRDLLPRDVLADGTLVAKWPDLEHVLSQVLQNGAVDVD